MGSALGENWPLEAQRRLNEVVASAPFHRLPQIGRFPDWLGYIGLVLQYCRQVEAETHAVSAALGAQLMPLVGTPSRASDILRVASTGSRAIRWQELEAIEVAYIGPRSF